MSGEITRRLLAWYSRSKRQLPWRDHPDPYTVWVSEIMLQQTRVETVIPYFERWMQRFPDIPSLAAASQQEVLQKWEGLGYYSRARNLHKAAQEVCERYAGQLPGEVELLRRLPGIGRYTAGAIASMAFGMDEPALDGNIRRVLSRVFNVSEPAASPQGLARLWELARGLIPPGQAGDTNQALMDLGSSTCTPRQPLCSACPIEEFCQARALGLQEERPVVVRKPPIPHYTVTAAVLCQGDLVLLARRPQNGLLAGLWEFPGGKCLPGEALDACLRREIDEELGVCIEVGESLGLYRHAYTHYKVSLHAFTCRLSTSEQRSPQPLQASELVWVPVPALGDYPMGKIDRQISRRLMDMDSGNGAQAQN
ncbi:MAG: A/G-specific adenine glycosylase [Chloroflexota bacterium]|nr:MAG: A/G-specific adenine glycosylase [Chloroflexota bacterium]